MEIAIDVGGTKIAAALLKDGDIIEKKKVDSIVHSDLDNLSNYLHELCKGWAEVASHVSIACTGQVGQSNVNFLSAKRSLPLKKQLQELFGLPITILNDAAAAAWAEFNNVNEILDETLVYITISTGIGGGVIQNGTLVKSYDGFCAHLGHMSVRNTSGTDTKCHCGRINCAEAIASGTAIAKFAKEILSRDITCKEVFESHLDNPEIVKLIGVCTDAITDLIANIKAITGTDVVVLGGSVGSSPIIQSEVKSKIDRLPNIYSVKLLPPSCGENADLIGAYLYSKSCS